MKILLVAFLIVVLVLLVTRKSNYPNDTTIVTAHWNEDLEWLKNAPYEVVVCDKEGAKPHNLGEGGCPTIINKGQEASSYLNYIVTNYDKLNHYTIFIHGHETSPHQNYDMIEEIKKREYIGKKLHYFSGGTNKLFKAYTSQNNDPVWSVINEIWKEQFEDVLGPMKTNITSDIECCAQFAVSREQILKVPKEVYERWLKFSIEFDVTPYKDVPTTGHIFEMLWEEIFKN